MDKIKASQFADLAYYSRFVPPSRTITFAAPASTLTNFPALVKCNSTFNIGTSTGYDVHFQDLSGNELAYELDYYDSVTGNGAWWVKIPSLPSTGTTSIKMLYGDSSASTNGSSPLTVWADYAAVYHFNEAEYSYQTNYADGVQSPAGFAVAGSMSLQSVSGGTGRVLRYTHPGTVNDKTQSITTTATFPSVNYSVTALWNHSNADETGNGRLFTLFGVDIAEKSVVNATETTNLQAFKGTKQKLMVNSGCYPNSCSLTSTSVQGMNLVGVSYSRNNYRLNQANTDFQTGNTGIWSNSYAWDLNTTFLSLVVGWSGTQVTEMDEIRACKSPHTQDWMAYEYSNYIDHANNVTYGPEV